MDENKNPFTKETPELTGETEQEETKTEDENKELEEETEIQEENEEDKKYEDLNNKYIRLAADFDNFRKRTQSEKAELMNFTQIELMKKIAPVLDTFDRAKEHLAGIDNCQTVKESYELAFKQFIDTLKKIGLEEIDALGKPFNPNEHEAVTQIQTDEFEPDTVALVVQKGYKLGDKVARAALVGVAVKKEND